MEITGQDILLIKKTNLVRAYRSESEGFKGKNYRIYTVNNKAFAVHEDDSFITDLDKGDVSKVMITVTDEGYSLENYISWTKANAFKMKEIENEAITVENFKPQRMVNAEEYAGL
jgi:hypothetical protein